MATMKQTSLTASGFCSCKQRPSYIPITTLLQPPSRVRAASAMESTQPGHPGKADCVLSSPSSYWARWKSVIVCSAELFNTATIHARRRSRPCRRYARRVARAGSEGCRLDLSKGAEGRPLLQLARGVAFGSGGIFDGKQNLCAVGQLVLAANRIAKGDLETRVAIHRTDAIGMLARSFNDMACQVRQQQAELEQKVQQGTAQLESANRRLNLEMAEKEEFLRAISHDLTAPLRNISGMTSMLLLKKRDALDEEAIHRLERIAKNVEVETGLISELMELSKIKSGRRRMGNFDLAPLVRDVAGVFESELHSKGIRLLIDTPLPVLHCERARIRQVFQNLFDNAIKYMGDGATGTGETGIREIHVGCSTTSEQAEFYVSDTGIGIDAEDQGTIFFVFRRGRAATAAAIAGKGVGLSTAKTIIETYGGNIWVESRVGQGSTFRFTISGKYFAKPRKLVEAA